MLSRPTIRTALLVLGGTFLAGLAPAVARKKPKTMPIPGATLIATPTETAEESDTNSIYEAVLLSMGPRWDGRGYVLLGGQVPSSTFIKRMERQHIFLHNARAPLSVSYQTRTYQISLSQPVRLSDSQASVYKGDGGSGSSYTLAKKDGVWKVTKWEQIWIR